MKNGRKIRFLQWAYVSSSCSMYWKCQQRLLMSVSLSHVWLINLWSSTTVEMSLFLHEIISLSHSLPVNLFLFIYFETGTLPCSFELLFSLHCLTTFSNTFAHWCICVCFLNHLYISSYWCHCLLFAGFGEPGASWLQTLICLMFYFMFLDMVGRKILSFSQLDGMKWWNKITLWLRELSIIAFLSKCYMGKELGFCSFYLPCTCNCHDIAMDLFLVFTLVSICILLYNFHTIMAWYGDQAEWWYHNLCLKFSFFLLPFSPSLNFFS